MLTKWLRGLLLGQVPLEIVSFAADAYEETKPPSTETLDLVQAVIAAAQVAALVATFIIAGIWIYRSARNVRAFGASDLTISPGWAVGWYFIPFANLFKPFQAMSEIWRASVDPANWRELKVPVVLRLWWGVWLVSNFSICKSERWPWAPIPWSQNGADLRLQWPRRNERSRVFHRGGRFMGHPEGNRRADDGR